MVVVEWSSEIELTNGILVISFLGTSRVEDIEAAAFVGVEARRINEVLL